MPYSELKRIAGAFLPLALPKPYSIPCAIIGARFAQSRS